MALYWNPWGASAVAIGALAFALAWIVFQARPDRKENRLLALILALQGFQNWGGMGWMYLTTEMQTAFAWQTVQAVASFLGFAVYAMFLGTLRTPLTLPFRRWWGIAPAIVWSGFLLVTLFVRPEWHFTGMHEDAWYTRWESSTGWLRTDAVWPGIALLTYAVIAAVDAWRRAPKGGLARRQGAAYVVAFTVRDVSIATGYLVYFFFGFDFNRSGDLALLALFQGGGLVFTILLATAMLRTQLFGFELQLKWTISRGTVVATIAAVAVAATITVQELILDELGWWAGGGAIAVMLLALRPLQRFGNRVAETAMPGVADTPEYRARRARDVYSAAWASALQDGEVTDKERDVLATVAQSLGLGPADVRAIERGAN